jgi:hypothetical protein
MQREEIEIQSDSESGKKAIPDAVPAWEQIENGRYRPRRIRGSFHGRELG